ncbi:Hypothetical predicted protein [Octopus vulgaris]|uniref:Uncharacterized protein n=1 Tax=Octopus vulgaris TaxID=6645 RepID=A0AA36FJ18_OCTVU|nr:Hypothetical predicted protein [Octopus vulgaris]
MERKEEENNTKKNEEQENYQEPKDNRKTESFTNSAQQVGESSTSLPGLDRKQSSSSQKNEVILKIPSGTSNSSNEIPTLERMTSEEAERIPIRKARNTSMNKSVKDAMELSAEFWNFGEIVFSKTVIPVFENKGTLNCGSGGSPHHINK